MDAPPAHEDTRPFLQVGQLLADAGLNVPAVLEKNQDLGLLLLSDLGEQTYYQRIQSGLTDSQLQALYRDASARWSSCSRRPRPAWASTIRPVWPTN